MRKLNLDYPITEEEHVLSPDNNIDSASTSLPNSMDTEVPLGATLRRKCKTHVRVKIRKKKIVKKKTKPKRKCRCK